MSNSDNPKIGAEFQRRVKEWFQDRYEEEFEEEKRIPIGNPEKDHKFDIVNKAGTIAIECKRYMWTETGNVPSAKIRATNEAAFFLSFLPESYDKYIVMLKTHHPKRQMSLAEYYYVKNNHLLGKIKVAEFDPEAKELWIFGDPPHVKPRGDMLKYYYIKDLSLFAKGKGMFENYIYKNGEWIKDNNIVSDRLMGYDPYEDCDSPYRIGNTSVMDRIQEISEEEFKRRTQMD